MLSLLPHQALAQTQETAEQEARIETVERFAIKRQQLQSEIPTYRIPPAQMQRLREETRKAPRMVIPLYDVKPGSSAPRADRRPMRRN